MKAILRASYALLIFGFLAWAPSSANAQANNQNVLGGGGMTISPEDRVILDRYTGLADHIQYEEAEKLLVESIAQRPSSVPIRLRLIEHRTQPRATARIESLEAMEELLCILGPKDAELSRAVAGQAAGVAGEEGKALVRNGREAEAAQFLVLAHLFANNEIDYSRDLPGALDTLFRNQPPSAEAKIPIARAALMASQSSLNRFDKDFSREALIIAIRARYDALLDEYIRGNDVADWHRESPAYFDYQYFPFKRRIESLGFPAPTSFDDTRPGLVVMSALATPSLLDPAKVGTRTERTIVTTQKEFLDREHRTLDQELNEVLMLLTNVEGFQYPYYQLYILECNAKVRPDDPTFQGSYRKIIDGLMADLRRLMEAREIPGAPAYQDPLGKNLKLLAFLRIHLPQLERFSK